MAVLTGKTKICRINTLFFCLKAGENNRGFTGENYSRFPVIQHVENSFSPLKIRHFSPVMVS